MSRDLELPDISFTDPAIANWFRLNVHLKKVAGISS